MDKNLLNISTIETFFNELLDEKVSSNTFFIYCQVKKITLVFHFGFINNILHTKREMNQFKKKNSD